MQVRVELRRKAGRFVPRFGVQNTFTGHLITARKSIQDREVLFLSVRLDNPSPDLKLPDRAPPELYEARITEVTGNEIRFMGWEMDDHAWHVQEWDCFVLR